MEVRRIRSQAELDDFLKRVDWSDAFIREVYVVSPSYIDKNEQWTVAQDSAPSMKVLVTIPDPACPGVELFFDELEEIYILFVMDLDPVGFVNDNRIEFYSVKDNMTASIRARGLRYKFLDERCWGWDVKFGKENFFFDEAGFPI